MLKRLLKASALGLPLLALSVTAGLTQQGGPAARNITPVTDNMLRNPPAGDWLMWRRTYNAWGYSPLEQINKSNVKNLKLAYAVALGGTSVNENLQATPLVEDGFMYVVDLWGIVYKIDVRSGETGRIVFLTRVDKRLDDGADRGFIGGAVRGLGRADDGHGDDHDEEQSAREIVEAEW